MIIGADGKAYVHPESWLTCPYCQEPAFAVMEVCRVTRGVKPGTIAIELNQKAPRFALFCHKTGSIVPQWFIDGKPPVIQPEPPAGKEISECGPGTSESSSPSSSPSSS